MRNALPVMRLLLRGLAGLGLIVWLVPYLAQPMAQDHGIFAWVADVVRVGGAPYRDAWDLKGPAVFALFAPLQDPTVLRLVDAIILGAGALLLYHLGRKVLSRPGALSAMAIWIVWYATLTYENSAQPDGWVGVALIAVVALGEARAAPLPLRAALQGLLLGGLCLIKPTSAVFGSIALVTILQAKATVPQRWRALATGAAAGLLPILVNAFWLARKGAWSAFVEVYLQYTTSSYAAGGGVVSGLARFAAELHGSLELLVGISLAVLGTGLLLKHRDPFGWVGAAWLGSSIAVLIAGQKFFPYHWLPVYPVAALLAVTGIEGALGLVPAGPWSMIGSRAQHPPRGADTSESDSKWRFASAIASFVLLGLLPAARALDRAADWWAVQGDPVAVERFERVHYGKDGRHASSVYAVATYLRAHTAPREPVQMFGMDAGLYHMSGRLPRTRFGTSLPLLSGRDSQFRSRYRREFMSAISRRPPIYLIARGPGCEDAMTRGLLDCLEAWPEFATWVRSRYSVETTIGPYEVYRLVDR